MSHLVCSQCQRSNSVNDRFCVYCGARLGQERGPLDAPDANRPFESPSGPDHLTVDAEARASELAEVKRQLGDAARLLSRLQLQVENLERAPAPHGRAQTPPASGAQGRQPMAALATVPSAGPIPQPGHGGHRGPPGGPVTFFWDNIDWEQVLGRNWFAIIGALALTLGVGFFLKLALDNDWIGDTGRIVLGIVVGIILLGIGEYAYGRVPIWAAPVTAAGLAILYFSIYAGFGFYELIAPQAAFLFLGLVSVLGALLAVRHESLVIALLGITGAFLGPVVLGRDLPDQRLLLPYILVIDVGILAVSTFRNWRPFTLIGMAASYLLFLQWAQDNPGEHVVLAESGLAGVFLVFVGATSLFHILWRRAPNGSDLALMTINAAAFFGLTFGLLWDDYEAWFGAISLSLSLLYCIVAYAAIKREGAAPEMALFSLSIAIVFLTIAFPLQFSGNWVTISWATEGAILAWLGCLLRRPPMRGFALGVLAVAAARLLVLDTPVELAGFSPVLNERFPTFAVGIAALYAAGYAYHRYRDRLGDGEVPVFPALLASANLLTLWLLSAEAIAFFDSHIHGGGWRDGDHDKMLTLTALWAVYDMGLMAIAVSRRSGLLLWAAAALLLAVAVKFLSLDTFTVAPDAVLFTPVLNFYFITFLILLAVFIFAAYAYRRGLPNFPGLEKAWPLVSYATVAAANVITIWVFSVEAYRYFNGLEVRSGDGYFSAMQLTLTLIWSLYAVGAVAVGIIIRSSYVRLAGMALLALPVVKLFVFDVFLMEREYRVIAFVTLGVVLLATGLVYQRYSHAIRGFLFWRPPQEAL